MQRKKPLIVMIIAGLSDGLLRSGHCPHLESFARAHGSRPFEPQLPALTVSMQATFTTGATPASHGIVGNGFFDRQWLEHRFWNAPAPLVDSPRFWQTPAAKGFHTGAIFWWNCLGSGLDLYMNVAPIHGPSGKTVSSCYSTPSGLYKDLEKEFGPFPLHRFWGPATSLESSAWILSATEWIGLNMNLDLLLTYIPHMDYSLQRSGPGSGEANRDLRELDDLLKPFLEKSLEGRFDMVILSEYGISAVHGAVGLNRALNEQGWFQTREVEGRAYPDLPGSLAFAICDHQVAHLYVRQPEDVEAVGRFVSSLPGVAHVLDRQTKAECGLNHPRAGDLVALSEPDQWFEYTWWDDPGRAPDYAFTVDIHRKIGYDPLELIWDAKNSRIASDPSLIRGSHGLIPALSSEWPLVITPEPGFPKSRPDREALLKAGNITELIIKLLAEGREDL
ncbi:MAG: nucleotide pyrophosphatase/phosphodiesterase family protein [Planctomycetota bacterium]